MRKEYNLKRPDENNKNGLEELIYLYNRKRAKKENIITNRVIDDNNSVNYFNKMKNQIKKYNDLNKNNIVLIEQKKVDKLFHDLIA